MSYKFIPALCEEGQPFTGHVVLEDLDFDTRMEIVEKVGLATPKEGGEISQLDWVPVARAMVSATKHLWVKCDIKSTEEGSKVHLKSFDDVSKHAPAHGILIQVAKHITKGGLGN